MIRIIRKRFIYGSGPGMYRCYCDECSRWISGHGRSKYLTWWQDKSGAERAADHHQLAHETARLMHGDIEIRPTAGDYDVPPNSGEYEDISAIPTVSK